MQTFRKITFRAFNSPFPNIDGDWRTESVPEHWSDDAIAEILAFRSGLNPGDIFELIPCGDGRFDLISTGTRV